MSLKGVDRKSGRVPNKAGAAAGEGKREARQERELRDVKDAINKGYRNQAIEGFYRK